MSTEGENAVVEEQSVVDEAPVESSPRTGWSEDWLAVILGLLVLGSIFATSKTLYEIRYDSNRQPIKKGEPLIDAATGKEVGWPFGESLYSEYVTKTAKWSTNPLDSVTKEPYKLLFVGGFSLAVFTIGALLLRERIILFIIGFVIIFLLAVMSNVMASQEVVKHYGLSYALWALLLGLIIANTVGLPGWLKPAVKTEFYIKTGLVLLGAEVLLPKLLALGLPGIFVAWVVTPVVLITTYWFGQKVLGIKSKSLNMVVAADMSVCGVSAAIATAAACKAKKEELSLAISMSLLFTVVMMVVMPGIINAIGMDPILGGAWMGGTIDSTGAVAAAGEFLGKDALYVATTVKMIQNILIGVTALCVAIYWTTVVERDDTNSRVGVGEIWKRFPKFVIGFVLASAAFSFVYSQVQGGPTTVEAATSVSKVFRGWWFALAFVSIGLESNFREFAKTLSGGKPLLLYLCGQTFNLCLTLGMAYLMFRVVFREWVDTALAK